MGLSGRRASERSASTCGRPNSSSDRSRASTLAIRASSSESSFRASASAALSRAARTMSATSAGTRLIFFHRRRATSFVGRPMARDAAKIEASAFPAPPIAFTASAISRRIASMRADISSFRQWISVTWKCSRSSVPVSDDTVHGGGGDEWAETIHQEWGRQAFRPVCIGPTRAACRSRRAGRQTPRMGRRTDIGVGKVVRREEARGTGEGTAQMMREPPGRRSSSRPRVRARDGGQCARNMNGK